MKENLVNPFKDKYPHLLSFSMTVLLLALTFFLSMTIALQSQNIRKGSEKLEQRMSKKRDSEPVNNSTNHPGYFGYNLDGKRFALSLPDNCQETDLGENSGQFNRFEITCKQEDFEIIINPQAGGRGLEGYEPLEYISGKLPINEYIWDYGIWIDEDGTAFSSYSLNLSIKDYYLIHCNYYPYSEEAKTYFEQILSTFKFISVLEGYSDNLVDIKFKERVDVSEPNILFPKSLESQINTITPLINNPVTENLQGWFRIKLKENIDLVSFLQEVKKLNTVETAEYVPLPQPPP